MKLVIDIPEEVKQTFDNAKNEDLYGNYYDYNSLIGKAIQNGIPLEQYKNRQKMFSYLDGVADGLNESSRDTIDVLDKLRAEIAEYGSIWVGYTITKDTKTDKGVEKLVVDILKQAKEQVLEIIDKYRAETEEENVSL